MGIEMDFATLKIVLASLRNAGWVVQALWAGLLITSVAALVLGRFSLAFVCLATIALSMTPLLVASRLAIRLPIPFLVGITAFIIASIFLGEALDFYNRLWWWDLALHSSAALGFGLLGFLFVFMLFEGDRYAAPPYALAVITFCVAMMIGSIWEIFEFGMDQLFGLNMQKSGLVDTMGDLILNAIGGLVASLAGYAYLHEKRFGPLDPLIEEFIALNKRYYQRARKRFRADE